MRPRIAFVVALVVLVYVVAVNAWVCDDAYITLRTVDNAVGGYGLTWNPIERVQAYTHPLWLLLLIPVYAVTGDAYWTVLGLSFAFSLGTALVLRRAAAVTLLIGSKAFVDYTTSGLETPLTYFLLAVFYGPLLLSGRRPEERGERSWVGLVLVAALAAVNRLDTLLLYLPALVWLVATRRPSSRRLVAGLAIGFSPLAAWELFSLIYYGFPFPNTAYAKLNTGIPTATLLEQGLHYFANSLRWDPVTLPLCAAAIAVGAVRRSAPGAAALGIGLYLGYLAWVGGDFMSGRFFAAPYLLACLIVVPLLRGWKPPALAGAGALLLSFAGPAAPLRTTRGYPGLGIDDAGVGDERGQYFQDSGLLHYRPGVFPNSHWMWAGLRFSAEETRVRLRKNTGFFGFAAGPEKTLIDPYALSDPLLARLPIDRQTSWRIGHFSRSIPEGYQESLLTGENRIADPDLRVYYDKLRLVVSGPLFGRDRLAAVVAMNLGRYGGYRDRYLKRRSSGDRGP
jgi:arabinofuranosyltransferase